MVLKKYIYDNDDLDGEAASSSYMNDTPHYPSHYDCYSGYGCAPGLVLSDSEESSYASCGTEEFFDLEEISHSLNLIENWQKLHRKVKFADVRVQEHAITVGDHPICKDGLALSLDWAHAEEKVYNIDKYESRRQNENQLRQTKRRRRVTKLDYWQRRETLIRVGNFSSADLSRMECKRNREAVSEFLQDLGTDDYGPSLLEIEEEGIEIEQVFDGLEYQEVTDTDSNDQIASSASDWGLGWQMNVQILEE